MSRTPPSSIRLTGGLVNYPQVATSLYYYKAHLKDAMTLEKAVNQLGKNIGFFTGPTKKRKNLPLLTLGVMPMYTQLRAKKYYQRLFMKSKHWFATRLFRGAQSSVLNYSSVVETRKDSSSYCSNPSCSNRHKCAKQAKLFYGHDKSSPIQNILKIESSSHWKKRFGGRALFTHCGLSIKRKQIKLPGCDALQRRIQSGTIPDGVGVGTTRKAFYKPKVESRRGLKKPPELRILSTGRQGWNNIGEVVIDYTKNGMSILSDYDIYNHGLNRRFDFNPFTGGSMRATRQSLWSKNSLFVLFCIEQIIGKRHFSKNSLQPGLACPVIEENKKRRFQFKKGFKKPYDIQSIRELESDHSLFIKKGCHYPRSAIAQLKTPRAQFFFFERKRGSSNTEGNTSMNSSDPVRNSGVGNRVSSQVDKLVSSSKASITPKFWISRTFHKRMGLNLFCFFEGRVSRGHNQTSHFKKTSIGQNVDNHVWARLKSGFVFEFDIVAHSKTKPDSVKSLKPTISFRF